MVLTEKVISPKYNATLPRDRDVNHGLDRNKMMGLILFEYLFFQKTFIGWGYCNT